jgi:hypothetical protein
MKETGKTKPEKENVTSNFGFPSLLLSLFCFVSVEWNDTTNRIPLPSYETRYPKFSMAVLRYVEHHQCPSTFGIGPTTLCVCSHSGWDSSSSYVALYPFQSSSSSITRYLSQ